MLEFNEPVDRLLLVAIFAEVCRRPTRREHSHGRVHREVQLSVGKLSYKTVCRLTCW